MVKVREKVERCEFRLEEQQLVLDDTYGANRDFFAPPPGAFIDSNACT
jgi:hypothetical protein